MADDYYAVLGLTREATEQDVKKAFRKIARECHPDVVGDDPAKLSRFKTAKEAYEVLSDAAARVKYDRRLDRRGQRMRSGGSFREAFYRRTAEGQNPGRSRPHQRSSKRVSDPANNIGLDDLFNDFGFGDSRAGSGGRTRTGGKPGGSAPRDSPFQRSNVRSSAGRERTTRAPMPQAGSDVNIDLDVPEHVARDGGTVDATYRRMQRSDSWRPGSPEPGVMQIRDIAVVRLLPGTRDGEILHEKGQGNAGPYGGPYGDLVVRVRVVPGAERAAGSSQDRGSQRRKASPKAQKTQGPAAGVPPSGPAELVVDVGFVTATLGGQVTVQTPQGRVRLTVPAGTSSDKKLRLRNKGTLDIGGSPTDLTVRLRIVVPSGVSEESQELLRQFAALNPESTEP